ncbi:MAG: AmmeMemoRadiSam system radical SAM enzyme [Candidatus Omnitrophota bacterium]
MNAQSTALESALAQYTQKGELYETLPNGKARCFACGHRCLIPEGRPGVCKVRFNEGGELRVPFGYAAGLQCDPIEKKPFYHALPGSSAMSFGMMGCDFHCLYCQNWLSSQVLRDSNAAASLHPISAREIVDLALRYGARFVTSTYNEPLITSEWAVSVFRLAKEKGLRTSYVSNGNATPEVLRYLRPWLDMYKVDLKSFRDKEYRKLGGKLETVLDSIRRLREMEFWVEIVTLCVPGLNDSEGEMREIAQFIASVDRNIPWHITAFHEDYKMRGIGRTRGETLLRAGRIGKEAGLKFVYVGNLPGYAPEWENTYCPKCGALLIERNGYFIKKNSMHKDACPQCGERIAGVWE